MIKTVITCIVAHNTNLIEQHRGRSITAHVHSKGVVYWDGVPQLPTSKPLPTNHKAEQLAKSKRIIIVGYILNQSLFKFWLVSSKDIRTIWIKEKYLLRLSVRLSLFTCLNSLLLYFNNRIPELKPKMENAKFTLQSRESIWIEVIWPAEYEFGVGFFNWSAVFLLSGQQFFHF